MPSVRALSVQTGDGGQALAPFQPVLPVSQTSPFRDRLTRVPARVPVPPGWRGKGTGGQDGLPGDGGGGQAGTGDTRTLATPLAMLDIVPPERRSPWHLPLAHTIAITLSPL